MGFGEAGTPTGTAADADVIRSGMIESAPERGRTPRRPRDRVLRFAGASSFRPLRLPIPGGMSIAVPRGSCEDRGPTPWISRSISGVQMSWISLPRENEGQSALTRPPRRSRKG